ncbi:MAG: hypothetical protein D6795_15375, partial [Deltaproteobacteria bacterium]
MWFNTDSGYKFYQDSSLQMVIASGGKIGLGVANPTEKLHVFGNVKADRFIDRNNGNYYLDPASTGSALFVAGEIHVGMSATTDDDYVYFDTGTAEWLRWDDNPGQFEFSDDLLVGGNLTVTGTINGGAGNFIQNQFASAQAANFYIAGSGRVDTNFYAIGNVGIGTASPQAKLHVTDGGVDILQVVGAGSSVDTGWLVRLGPQNGAQEGGHLEFKGAANGSNTDFQDWVIDTYSGDLRIFEPVQSRSATRLRGDILFMQNSSTTSTPNQFAAMTIKPSGNVGIGTTTPSAKLEISGGYLNTVRSGWSGISIVESSSGKRYWLAHNGSRLWLKTPDGIERFVLAQNGNVGVGTSTPSQKLHVSGNLRVTGAYYDSSNVAGTNGQILQSTGTGTKWVNPGTLSGSYILNQFGSAQAANFWIAGAGKIKGYLELENLGSSCCDSAIRLNNRNIVGVNTFSIADPGAGEGILWGGSNAAVFVSTNPNGTGNTDGWLFLRGGSANGIALSAAKSYVSGNLGIGTSTPSQKLHVSGNLRVTGAYYDSSNVAGTDGQILQSTGTGTKWVDPSTVTSGNFIKNQFSSAQAANFWIAGQGRTASNLIVDGEIQDIAGTGTFLHSTVASANSWIFREAA